MGLIEYLEDGMQLFKRNVRLFGDFGETNISKDIGYRYEKKFDNKEKIFSNVILPSDYCKSCDQEELIKAAVFIHLHYVESVDYFLNYVNNIPDEIDIYISYTLEEVGDKLRIFKSGLVNKKIFLKKKENRGRDISSLLVAFRENILDYKYICFIHDKKEKKVEDKRFVDEWIYSIWENMISSYDYVKNIVMYFEQNDKVGLLVPPIYLGRYSKIPLFNLWGADYENVVNLAKDLKLECNIDYENQPIAIGTCFWAKSKALKKLFTYKWEYENFRKEPLPNDGTLSHAIERILPYVSRDAGFETCYVMTGSYASKYIEDNLNVLYSSKKIMENELGIHSSKDIYDRNSMLEKLHQFVKGKKRIFIFGAGKIGKAAMKLLLGIDCVPESFIVTKKEGNDDSILGIPVMEFDVSLINDEDGIIIATSNKFVQEIIELLIECGIEKRQIFKWMM